MPAPNPATRPCPGPARTGHTACQPRTSRQSAACASRTRTPPACGWSALRTRQWWPPRRTGTAAVASCVASPSAELLVDTAGSPVREERTGVVDSAVGALLVPRAALRAVAAVLDVAELRTAPHGHHHLERLVADGAVHPPLDQIGHGQSTS